MSHGTRSTYRDQLEALLDMHPVVPIRATEIPVRYADLVLGTLAWSRHERGLKVRLPAEKPCEHAYALKVVIR